MSIIIISSSSSSVSSSLEVRNKILSYLINIFLISIIVPVLLNLV